jgi:hypothetical protein
MTAAFVTTDLDASGRQALQDAKKPGIWKRLHQAIVLARMRQAEREIAAYLEANGGRLTDQLERHIFDRASGIDPRVL